MSETARSSGEVEAEYARRLAAHQARVAELARQDHTTSNARLAFFVLGALVAWLSWGQNLFSAWWLVVPLIAFVALLVAHDRIIGRTIQAARAAKWYELGLLRVRDKWAGTGVTGSEHAGNAHPYAADLDIFGRGSLFELLCTARTRSGEACLADWLRAPSPPQSVRARQTAVEELRNRLDLREDMALLGEDVRSSLDSSALARWGNAPALLPSRALPQIALLIAAFTVFAAVAWNRGMGPIPFVVCVLLGRGVAFWLRKPVALVVGAVENPARDLAVFGGLLARLEQETFSSSHLQNLRAELNRSGEAPPSLRIAQLARLVGLLNARQSIFFAPLAAALLWTPQVAFALEAWRKTNGLRLAQWLRVVGEFEALGALSGYAYEHPADLFPEIADTGLLLRGVGLAHPLLPAAGAVRNDVTLDENTRLLLVSGSNMSGKSTLMRTVGVNVVLAFAGAPVRAQQLRVAPMQIGASLRTQDSLQGGISRFYAEITRLRQIVELTNAPLPLLFLLDEILHGTNSHDRRVGAEAVIRSLVARGAIGFVTTHDLALARIADDPALSAVNVHFEDHLEDGKMRFDYRLRPGVVAKSNALELMRAVGLDV